MIKKYILGLFAISFVLVPIFSFAQVEYPDPGPSTTNCVYINNNLRYRDRDIYTNNEVSTLQDFLQGKGYLNNEPTGYFGLLTFGAVKSFQTANGISQTGYVGPVTREKIRTLTCNSITPNFSKPVISGTQGPQSLNINETGTWRILATDIGGGDLSYSVNWGDVGVIYNLNQIYSTTNNLSQSSTFTHSYSQAGNYTVVFTVTNNLGRSATTSLSVNVVNVNPVSAITVLSPNGGETLYKGNTTMITWQDTANLNCTSMGGINCAPSNFSYDIYLNYYHTPCTGICPIAINAVAPLVIANGVHGSSYNWQVGNFILNGGNTYLPSGLYKISICKSGYNGGYGNICDASDSPFVIQ